MDLLQKQASNRRLNFIERQYVSILLYSHHSFPFFSFSSEERTQAIQYVLHQREQINHLINEKQSVNFRLFFFK
jgi:hypothetical protein